MNKYSIVTIVLAVIIGVSIGWFSKTNQSNNALLELQKKHETELVEQSRQAEKSIQERDKTILELKSHNKQDSTAIVDFKYKIDRGGFMEEQKLNDLQKLNADEKIKWITDRYSH